MMRCACACAQRSRAWFEQRASGRQRHVRLRDGAVLLENSHAAVAQAHAQNWQRRRRRLGSSGGGLRVERKAEQLVPDGRALAACARSAPPQQR
jgi:hypothetical protein